MQVINLFFDESGDLGVKGGRFFLISAIEIEEKNLKTLSRRAGRIINDFKKEYNISKQVELKGSLLKRGQRIDLLSKIVYHGVLIRYIVLDIWHTTMFLKKADDKNACYNYLVQLIIKDVINDYKSIDRINLYLDNRSVKIGNRLSLKPYLYNKLVLENMEMPNAKRIEFNVNYLESESCYLIQFVDIIANSIYKKYTNKSSEFFNLIRPYIIYSNEFPSNNFGK